MTARDNLSPKQFYHGSRAPLEVGDYITTPESRGAEPRYDKLPKRQLAVSRRNVYASASFHEAEGMAKMSPGAKDDDGPPTVYVVEPTGPMHPDNHDRNLGWEESYRSHHPMRITDKWRVG